MSTANDIIIQAFNVIGISDPDERDNGKRVRNALFILNALINSYSQAAIYIPLTNVINFNTVPNKYIYTIANNDSADIKNPPLISIEYANLNYPDNNITYPLDILNSTAVYSNPYMNVKGRPREILLEQSKNQSTISLFPTPDRVYNFILRVKQILDKLEFVDVLDEIPESAQLFLIYALAKVLYTSNPAGNWKKESEDLYQNLKSQFTAANNIDLQVRSDSILRSSMGRLGNFSNILSPF